MANETDGNNSYGHGNGHGSCFARTVQEINVAVAEPILPNVFRRHDASLITGPGLIAGALVEINAKS